MERQQCLALHFGKSQDCTATLSHNRNIGRLSWHKCLGQDRYYVLTMSVNRASTNFTLAWLEIQVLPGDINP